MLTLSGLNFFGLFNYSQTTIRIQEYVKYGRIAVVCHPYEGLLNKPLDGRKNKQLQDNRDECTSRADKNVEFNEQFRKGEFLKGSSQPHLCFC